MDSTTITRTTDTEKRYIAVALNFLATIPAELIDPEQGVHPNIVFEHYLSRTANLRPASIRQLRSSLIFYYSRFISLNPDTDSDLYLELIDKLRNTRFQRSKTPKQQFPIRTSSHKAKHTQIDDLLKLGAAMTTLRRQSQSSNRSSRYGFWPIRSFVFFAAGIAAGLRPSEWPSASAVRNEDGTLTLTARNAKHTNGRACGDTRTITIPDGWMANYVAWHIDSVQSWLASGNQWETYYNNCAESLRRAVRQLWGQNPARRYTLYSARHQFCSNAKRAGLSKREIATLMGHASEETATTHYGKRRSGISSLICRIRMPDIQLAQERTPAATTSHPEFQTT